MTTLRILLVEDSVTMQELMKNIIESATDMQIVGIARNGKEAVEMTHKLRPNIIVMDIVMPVMDGLDATREIMYSHPTPIVMVTAGLDRQETDVAFKAIRMGALQVLKKPSSPKHPKYEMEVATLLSVIRAMAGVKVIHHRKSPDPDHNIVHPQINYNASQQAEIIAIAVSTGGPSALNQIISGLPADFSIPIVIVQHISRDFLPSLVQWLQTNSALPISIAESDDTPRPGHIYFAPGDAHLSITKSHRFHLEHVRGTALYMPSGDILLSSVASSYGAKGVGLVLTGMGDDGTRGLLEMMQAGAYTIAQDEESSVVYGMPQVACDLGVARDILPLSEISQSLVSIHLRNKKGTKYEQAADCINHGR